MSPRPRTISWMSWVMGVAMRPGATAFNRIPAPAHDVRHRVPSHPAGQGQLRRGVGAHAVAGHVEGGGLVPGQAGLDDSERDPGLGRRGVRADGHGAGRVGGRQERTQALERGDRAEVVDGDDEPAVVVGHAGARDEAVEPAPRQLGHRLDHRGAALGRSEVRDHVGVAHVDADHRVPGGLEPVSRGRPDPPGRSRHTNDHGVGLVVDGATPVTAASLRAAGVHCADGSLARSLTIMSARRSMPRGGRPPRPVRRSRSSARRGPARGPCPPRPARRGWRGRRSGTPRGRPATARRGRAP